MGLEVKGCVNQLELFTFEQALRRAGRFHTVVREDCTDYNQKSKKKTEKA